MKHETKSFRTEVKAYDELKGTAEAVVSVFGNVDLGGDRVMPGAFAKTLDEWKAKGDPIPVIWSHEWDDPTSHIGIVEDAAERADLGGLWVKMRFDIEANPKAAYVARLLKERRVTQFSFGYFARDWKQVTDSDGTTVRELLDIDLFEVGPTLLGMNPATQLLEAASYSAEDAKAFPEVKVDAPRWMARNAAQGLAWYEEGLAGDGVVQATIREARAMAAGTVSDAKARKMAAWFARHMTDLDSPDADPESENYPSPGVVAHALWGGGAKAESERALRWAERRVAQIERENESGKADEPDTKNEEPDEETGSRDTPDKLIPSELLDLLARTRHQEN